MFNDPKTLEEAKNKRYGTWAGRPSGDAYDPDCCAYQVFSEERSVVHHQCRRKNGHGIERLYCKQHAKMVKKH